MKNSRLLCRLTSIVAAIFCLSFISCVDEKYDMKDIDTEVVILKDVTLPIGNIEGLTIEHLLSPEAGQSLMINPDPETGDFIFGFSSTEPIKASVNVPKFNVELTEDAKEERRIAISVPESLAGKKVADLQKLMPELFNSPISYESVTGVKAASRKAIVVEENSLLPHYLEDVKTVFMDARLNYEFSLDIRDIQGLSDKSGGPVYIRKGFTIDFPDYFSVNKADKINGYTIDSEGNNKNVLRFIEDVKVEPEQPLLFKLNVNKVEIPQGTIVPGGVDSEGRKCKRLELDPTDEKNMILIEGDFYFNLIDFVEVPSRIEMNMALQFSSLDVTSALASLNINETLPDQTLSLPEIPELFRKEGMVLDVYDPVLTFSVSNPSPVDVLLDTQIFAYYKDEEKISMYLGENGEHKPFVVPRSFNGNISFSRRGENGAIANPGVAGVFRALPDKVTVKNIGITTSKDYVTVVPGESLECSLDYSFNALLAFGPDLNMAFEYDMKNLDLDLGQVGLKKAKIRFDVVSSIPLALDVDAQLIDENGNPDNDVMVDIDGSIKPGLLHNTSSSPITISLTSRNGNFKLKALRLLMAATCTDPEYQGKALNKSQGLEIKNMSINIPDGVSMDLDNLLEDSDQ